MAKDKNRVISVLIFFSIFAVAILLQRLFSDKYYCPVTEIHEYNRSITATCTDDLKISTKVPIGLNIRSVSVGDKILIEKSRYLLFGEEQYLVLPFGNTTNHQMD